jgi:hypothetical protein
MKNSQVNGNAEEKEFTNKKRERIGMIFIMFMT